VEAFDEALVHSLQSSVFSFSTAEGNILQAALARQRLRRCVAGPKWNTKGMLAGHCQFSEQAVSCRCHMARELEHFSVCFPYPGQEVAIKRQKRAAEC
jgi:hypothetical protein